MASDTKADIQLRTLKEEVVKIYKVYDGSDRVITMYEAVANAANNSPCLVSTYTYVGASNRVEKMKEEIGVWLVAYDI